MAQKEIKEKMKAIEDAAKKNSTLGDIEAYLKLKERLIPEYKFIDAFTGELK